MQSPSELCTVNGWIVEHIGFLILKSPWAYPQQKFTGRSLGRSSSSAQQISCKNYKVVPGKRSLFLESRGTRTCCSSPVVGVVNGGCWSWAGHCCPVVGGSPSYQHRYKVLPQPGMEPTKDSLQASSQGDAGGMLLCSQLRASVTVTCTWLNNPNTVAPLTISWNGDMFCCRGMIYRRCTRAKTEAGSQCVPAKDILALLCCPLQVDPEDPWPWTIRLAPTRSEITRGSGRDYL